MAGNDLESSQPRWGFGGTIIVPRFPAVVSAGGIKFRESAEERVHASAEVGADNTLTGYWYRARLAV